MHQEFCDRVSSYFTMLDSSIDALSMHNEGRIASLPSWVHQVRRITVGVTPSEKGVAIKVEPDETLDRDIVEVLTLATPADVQSFAPPPFGLTGSLDAMGEQFISMGDFTFRTGDNPLSIPVLDKRALLAWGGISGFNQTYSEERAKQDAINLWNSALTFGMAPTPNYVADVKNVLSKFRAIIKRKAFLERRIHRFINEHKAILLPSHKTYLTEHSFSRGDESRRADIILEREQGLAPMLIELESPAQPVLTKKGDLTAAASHAVQQIIEWIAFIRADTSENASERFAFLSGATENLVIIGRGLERKTELLAKRFSGTTVWTYDILIEEACHRLNEAYAAQCQMLRLPVNRPF